jgi:hypothetical protein
MILTVLAEDAPEKDEQQPVGQYVGEKRQG